MVDAYHARGMSPRRALKEAQIEPALLRQKLGHVTAAQMEIFSSWAMQELDDEALGWFTRRLPWGSYGMLARASVSAPTLGVALKRWCRHHALLTDDIGLTLQVRQHTATLSLTEHRPLSSSQREFCVVSMLRNALGLSCWLVDSRIPLMTAQFAFEAPAHAASYGVLFDALSTFSHETHAISFDARYLNLPVQREEAALQRMLQRALLLTVRPYKRDRLLVERVRQTLLAHPHSLHNARALATLVHVSERTLHRQLKEEGASLQGLKDSVRQELAMRLLTQTQKPIKQIATEVGFASDKSFLRALKGWTGMTAGEVRGGLS
jgi:AraC-like DNA-binding protein